MLALCGKMFNSFGRANYAWRPDVWSNQLSQDESSLDQKSVRQIGLVLNEIVFD